MSFSMDIMTTSDLAGVESIDVSPTVDCVNSKSQTGCLKSSKLTKSQSQQLLASSNDMNKIENELAVDDKNPQHSPHQDQQLLLPEEFKKSVDALSRFRNRWYTNEEVASILTNFASHPEWQTNELQVRPKSGAVFVYSREKVRYRQDGYCWKKRKNGRTTREDHMKLKVQGIECIYGCYVHSAILPTFHRRCYWLLQNPDVVLVHYLNQPLDDQNKMLITLNPSSLEADTRRSWTHEEIIQEIGSVFGGISQVQQMLNKNFPSSAKSSIINQLDQQGQQNCQDRVGNSSETVTNDSNSLSHQSQVTQNSEAMIEQVDMAIVDNQQTQRAQSQQLEGSSRELIAEDEMMAISQDSNSDLTRPPNSTTIKSKIDFNTDVHEHLQQQDQQYSTARNAMTSMTFGISNGCEDSQHNDLADNGQSDVDCFGYTNNSNDVRSIVGVNNLDVIDSNNNSNNDIKAGSASQGKQLSTSGLVGQNPCSPVTQIYNKIVDDIETYVLPLEPSQFGSGHHHHHGMSMSSSMPVQSMELGETKHRRSVTQINHHNLEQSRRHNPDDDDDDGDEMDQHFLGSDDKRDHLNCSVDMNTCDLFSGPVTHDDHPIENSVVRAETHGRRVIPDGDHQTNVGDGGDNLLLSDFDLQSSEVGQVNDDLETGCVADSLTGVDDLRDLIMGISSNENVDANNPLLVDTNSLDLFNFKSDCKHRDQQMDFKSSISDTDAMNRFSPLLPVPRCNSTGNAMQPLIGQHHNYQQQPQHLSSQLLTCTQESPMSMGGFNGFQSAPTSHRPSSTNPTSSTSCSPTPSTSLMHTGLMCTTGHMYINNNAQYNVQTNSSTNSFIKLPLQQRQKSEQQETSTMVVSGLLPKAVSLDGGDLASSHATHRMSPLISYNLPQGDEASGRAKNSTIISSEAVMTDSLQSQQQVLVSSIINHTGPAQLCSLLSPGVQSNSTEVLMGNTKSDCIGSNSQRNSFQGFQAYQIRDALNFIPNEPLVNCANQFNSECSKLLKIVDYSPTWCNVAGGAKVLIIGDWSGLVSRFSNQNQASLKTSVDPSSGFAAIFDLIVVPATLITDNVLRCFAPGHEEGKIFLKVLYNNQVATEPVIFEMRSQGGQTVDQCPSSDNPGDDNDRRADSSRDNKNVSQNAQQQQSHRNSTSSNQSTSSMSSFSNHRPHETSSSANSISSLETPTGVIFSDNSRTVLRQRKGTCLMGSLEVESIEPRSPHQRQLSLRLRGPIQRRLTIVNGQAGAV